MSSPLVLGYWGIRGRGQVTRLVCAYTGVNWQQKTYSSPQEWFGKDKQQLGILFPNLPYILDDDIKISESDILPRYVIKKSGKIQLLGKDHMESALIDNVIYVVLDLWGPIVQLFFNKKWEDEKTAVFYKLKSKLDKIEKFINGKATSLGYLTLADFFISEFSYYVEKLFPADYKKYKSMQNIRNTIENLEQVKNYYSQENAVQAAFLPPTMTVFPFFLDQFTPKLPPVPVLSEKLSSISPTKRQQKKQLIINNGQKLKIVLINSSLRKASTNAGLLRACVELNHPNFEFQWANITEVPFFNEDLQNFKIPQSVERVRIQFLSAHGVLFGVTENNYAVSAVLKNIYDWLSRGGENSAVYRIPAGMISSGGGLGGLRGQKSLRQIGSYCQVKFMQNPTVTIKRFQGKFFDENGNLIDDGVRDQLRKYLQAFALWVDTYKRNQ